MGVNTRPPELDPLIARIANASSADTPLLFADVMTFEPSQLT